VLDKGDAKKALGSTSGHAVRLTPDAPVLVLCEGVETALAVLKALLATGAVPAGEIAVWATLGTSGLAHVAIPAWAAEIIVMGDHDPERTRANGERYRPGHAAVARLRERAEITQPIKAAYPEIEGQDWADVLAAEGEAPIRAALTAAMSAPVVKEPKPAKAAVVVPSPEATGRLDYVVKSSNGMRYYGPLPLGSDEKRLLFWNRRRQTTYDIARPRCHLQAELEGGCDHEWFLRLPDLFVVRDETGAKVLWHNIGHYLKRLCDDLGPFNEDRLRGLGATLDGKRLVFRLGDRLLVDGRLTDLDDYNFSDGPQPGRMIFPRVHNLPFEATEVADDGRITGATDEQAQLVRRTFGELKWRYPQHATFVAGWCMIAAVCGALPWRPHVHLGGESAVGKSWAQDYLIGRAVPIALKPMLSSTRAGIAQAVGIDARPVLYDEAETETERARQQMQEIMLMARGASTGYGERVELKGTTHGQARRSMTRSMYLISAINLPTMQLADESRWVLVELLKQGGSPAEAERDQRRFRRCQELLDQWPSNIGDLLTARAIRHFDTLIANYTLLREVVRRKLSARLGDTYGMLLAGDQLMQHTRVLTEAEARAVVNSLRWEDAEDASSDSDAIRFLRHISGYRMRITSDAGNHSSTQEVTIYELVDLLVKRGESNLLGVSIVDAERVLGAYGLRVADSVLTSDKKRPGNMLWFANDPGVNWKKLIAGTQWAGSHKAPLRALAAVPSNGSIGFNGGLRATRARGIPVDIFLGEDDAVNAGRPDEPIASTAAEEEDIPY
jgi:putative DNA primase/helicase